MTIQEILADDSDNDKRLKINSNFTELDERSEGLEGGLEEEVILKLSDVDSDYAWRNTADAAIKGDVGEGVPAAGTTDQVLTKLSNADYDTDWVDGASDATWDPVRLATTEDVDLATGGLIAVDAVTVSEDDRVLVWQQSDTTENGIYTASSGAWTRSTDADAASDFTYGKAVVIGSNGALYYNQIAILTESITTLDSESVVFLIAIPSATEEQFGTLKAATQEEVDDGEAGTDLAVTPEKLAAYSRIYRNLVTIGSDVTNATTSFADVTGLSFAVTSGTVYRFEFIIAYSVNATTTGSQWSINGPSTTLLAYEAQWYTAASTLTSRSSNAYNSIGGAGSDTPATTGNIAKIKGIIKPSASGTVIARFASEVAVASAVVAKAGSMVEYW